MVVVGIGFCVVFIVVMVDVVVVVVVSVNCKEGGWQG